MDDINVLTALANQAALAMENASLYENLENKVAERTMELQKARDALWGEMKLAKKIQTLLLPEKPEIKGYEITGYMEPVNEVGGDYYDIINAGDDADWVIIGDVCGHGLPAGLIMMMVQTAMRILLYAMPTIKPYELLNQVNDVITYNMTKLEQMFMAITAMRLYRDGRAVHSGLQRNILVYRSKNKSVESIETDGLWFGYLDLPGRKNQDFEFMIHSNDAVLLYSDGIVEASDKDGNLFKEEKLIHILEQCGIERPETIKEKILNALKEYKVNDDITLVVLKRNTL